MTLAIIPARAGSKRIVGKNLRTVGGVPLVVRAIRCAVEAGLEPLVSTEDLHTAEVASAAGASIVLRPLRLAGDTSQLEPAIMHALRSTGWAHKRFAVLQPTSPLRRAEDVRAAMALLESGRWDSVIGVTRDAKLAFAGRLRPEPGDEWRWVPFAPNGRPRTQDVARESRPLGADCGYLYATTAAMFRQTLRRDGGRCAALVVPSDVAVDVDTEADLRVAEALLAVRGAVGAEVV